MVKTQFTISKALSSYNIYPQINKIPYLKTENLKEGKGQDRGQIWLDF